MSDEINGILDSSFDNGIPFLIHTSDYIYGLVPLDPNASRWKEVSFMFDGADLETREMAADLSFQFLLEEMEKGLSHYCPDLKVLDIKGFVETVKDKSGEEKIKAIIQELINNSSAYSSALPIIKSKDEIAALKGKF